MREKDLKEDLATLAYKAESDHEVQMARSDLYKIAKYSIKLHEMLKTVDEQQGIEGWVQSKITKAADYMGSVYHHLDYEMKFDEMTEGVKTPGDSHYNKEKAKELAKKDGKDPERLSYGELQSYIAKAEKMKESKKAKPDFLDIDGDDNKKEPMKKAVKDKEKKKDKSKNESYIDYLQDKLNSTRKFQTLEESVGKPISEEEFDALAEKQDACYHKVKSRYKVWPSAYASGALVQCRKKGAKNWGNKSK